MPDKDRQRTNLLAGLIGASVGGQAIAGFTQVWKQSALYLSVKTDGDLFDFLALMSQANTADSDEKMQEFYQAVQAYNSDPGHVDDPSKIQECLDLAVEALAVEKVSVEAVMKIRQAGEGGQALLTPSPQATPKKASVLRLSRWLNLENAPDAKARKELRRISQLTQSKATEGVHHLCTTSDSSDEDASKHQWAK